MEGRLWVESEGAGQNVPFHRARQPSVGMPRSEDKHDRRPRVLSSTKRHQSPRASEGARGACGRRRKDEEEGALEAIQDETSRRSLQSSADFTAAAKVSWWPSESHTPLRSDAPSDVPSAERSSDMRR